jgi:hypothetical protein
MNNTLHRFSGLLFQLGLLNGPAHVNVGVVVPGVRYWRGGHETA